MRGLTISGLGTGSNGILFNSGGNLEIENCVIRNFTFAGTLVQPTGPAAVTGVLTKVITYNNGNGIVVNGAPLSGVSLNVTIVDSEASNNQKNGIQAFSAAGSAATAVMVRNSVASNNGTGLEAEGALLRVAHSVVTGNSTGVFTFGSGIINSYGDNDIDGNTSDNTAVLTPLAMH